jgi:thiamine biosynthesis lipoprotein
MKRNEFHAMGSRMLAALDNHSRAAGRALEQVPAWFEEWEQCLSRFRPDSELSRLNRLAGSPVGISQTLWDVFQCALEAEADSSGLVTPVVLDALVKAGYDRSFELVLADDHPFHTPDRLDPVPVWDESGRIIYLPENTRLDLGGVAKGWSAHQAMLRLSPYGPALVDAGGDIAISAPRANGDPWVIGVNDPFRPGTNLHNLYVNSGGVATSGTDYHRWQQGTRWNHHIIDPRSGLPAETDVLTATVLAPTVMQAETAAKTALILGSQAGLDRLEADPTLAGLLVLTSGEHVYSRRIHEFI